MINVDFLNEIWYYNLGIAYRLFLSTSVEDQNRKARDLSHDVSKAKNWHFVPAGCINSVELKVSWGQGYFCWFSKRSNSMAEYGSVQRHSINTKSGDLEPILTKEVSTYISCF